MSKDPDLFAMTTPEVRVAMVFAQEEARRVGRSMTALRDLLMGLVCEREPDTPDSLRVLLSDEGVDVDSLWQALVDRAGPASQHPVPGLLPLDHDVRSVVEGAFRLALARQDRHIGGAHVLKAGMTRSPEEKTFLHEQGCTEDVVDRILNRLESPLP